MAHSQSYRIGDSEPSLACELSRSNAPTEAHLQERGLIGHCGATRALTIEPCSGTRKNESEEHHLPVVQGQLVHWSVETSVRFLGLEGNGARPQCGRVIMRDGAGHLRRRNGIEGEEERSTSEVSVKNLRKWREPECVYPAKLCDECFEGRSAESEKRGRTTKLRQRSALQK